MLADRKMIHVGIGGGDRVRIDGGMAVVLPFLELVHKIKRQTRQLRLQLAADALRLLVERGAAFRKTALGVGTLFRRAARSRRGGACRASSAERSSARRCSSASRSVCACAFALRADSIFALRLSIKVSIGWKSSFFRICISARKHRTVHTTRDGSIVMAKPLRPWQQA